MLVNSKLEMNMFLTFKGYQLCSRFEKSLTYHIRKTHRKFLYNTENLITTLNPFPLIYRIDYILNLTEIMHQLSRYNYNKIRNLYSLHCTTRFLLGVFRFKMIRT